MATKTQVLNWFRGQLGYVEGKGNKTKYAAMAGHTNGLAWCATFVCAGFRKNNMQLGNNSAWTPSLRESLGAKIGGPQVGAIGFMYFPSLDRVAHMGIVEEVRPDGRFVTIEGNTNTDGSRTGGKVMRKVRSTHNWSFYMPDYSEPTPTPKPPPPPVIVGGVSVKRLQAAIRATADGQWGPITDKHMDALRLSSGYHGGKHPHGVKFTQKVVGTKQDGIWGPASIASHRSTTLAFQIALKAARFDPMRIDGIWGPNTERAYKAARSKYRR